MTYNPFFSFVMANRSFIAIWAGTFSLPTIPPHIECSVYWTPQQYKVIAYRLLFTHLPEPVLKQTHQSLGLAVQGKTKRATGDI